jgi:hypothetical protein
MLAAFKSILGTSRTTSYSSHSGVMLIGTTVE